MNPSALALSILFNSFWLQLVLWGFRQCFNCLVVFLGDQLQNTNDVIKILHYREILRDILLTVLPTGGTSFKECKNYRQSTAFPICAIPSGMTTVLSTGR